MSLLRHVQICNDYRADGFVPFWHADRRLGFIRKDNVPALHSFPTIFALHNDGVYLIAPGDHDALSAIIDDVTDHLVAAGRVAKVRNEYFAAAPRWGAAPHFRIDRGAVPFFGIKAYGVHLNGYVRDGDRLLLWVGRRSPKKAVAPGKLDNLVAGGVDHAHGLFETLIKESAEEADIPAALAGQSRSAGAVSYRMAVQYGMRDDVLFCYDLELPADFVPRNTDGELVAFTREDAKDVIARVRAGDDFKFNVNLVLIDFALRHGLVTNDDPEYLDLATGLHRPID